MFSKLLQMGFHYTAIIVDKCNKSIERLLARPQCPRRDELIEKLRRKRGLRLGSTLADMASGGTATDFLELAAGLIGVMGECEEFLEIVGDVQEGKDLVDDVKEAVADVRSLKRQMERLRAMPKSERNRLLLKALHDEIDRCVQKSLLP
jgi:hypothetical protein